MSIKLSENIPLISNELGITQSPITEDQKRQVKNLYIIHFLSTISFIIITFILALFKQVIYEGDTRIEITSNLLLFFFIAQIIAFIAFGLISDKIGRKKVLNYCLLGQALTMGLFGFCKSTNFAIFISFLAGTFSCSFSIIKTILGESTSKLSRAQSFSYLLIVTGVASSIGSIIITIFAIPIIDPKKSPKAELVYLTPCLIVALINIFTFAFSRYYLKETLESRTNLDRRDIASSSTEQLNTLERSGLRNNLGFCISKDSGMVLSGLSIITLISAGFSIMITNWTTNELEKGGLKLTPEYLAMGMLIWPILLLAILRLYPSLNRKFGNLKLYKTLFLPMAVIFIICSMLTIVAKSGDMLAVSILVIGLSSSLLIINLLQNLCLDLMLIKSSELTGNLGTLFGISSALGKFLSLTSPSLFQYIYNFSTENNLPFPLDFNLTWIILITVSFIGYWMSSKIKNL